MQDSDVYCFLVGAGSLTIATVDSVLPVTGLDFWIPNGSRGAVVLDQLAN